MAKLSRTDMSYKQQYANSGRGISSKQYNGLVNMHRDIYQSNAGGNPTPKGLQQSVVADAVLHPDETTDIPPYTPVSISRNMGITNPGINTPSYEVVALTSEVDSNRMMSYGFTLGEGVSAANGGRIVISGVAFAMVEKSDMTHSSKLGTWDSLYYVVNDGSLMTTDNHSYLAPVGHFRLISWSSLTQVNNELADDDNKVLLMLDMDTSPDAFVVTTEDTCDKVVDDEDGLFTMTAVEGNVRYLKSNLDIVQDPAEMTLTEPTVDAENYKVLVYNMVGADRSTGSHSVEYSKVYGCFVFSGLGQTVKIGKADAAITAGSTGTISIWRDGADTTENIEDVELDWMHGSTDVSLGKQVMITYFADEAIWRITGAECEDAV